MKEVVDKFVSKWAYLDNQKFASESDFSDVESSLNLALPAEYVYLVSEYGDVYCPNLLDEIVDREIDISDVQNFLLPNEMIETTSSWEEAGMPKGYLSFASDCMGNVFCFKVSELREKETPRIYMFDHDFCEITKVSKSFISWIKQFTRVGDNKFINMFKSLMD